MRQPCPIEFIFFSFLLGLSLSNCGDVDYEINYLKYTGQVNSCKNNNDCSSKYICNKEFSLCVHQDAPERRLLYAKIFPKQRVSEVFRVTLSREGVPILHFPAEYKFGLQVQSEAGTAIPADINIKNLRVVPGHQAQILSAKVAVSSRTRVAYFNLYEGRMRYNIEVLPERGAPYIPRYFDNVSVIWDSDLEKARLIDEEGNDLSVLTLLQAKSLLKGKIVRGLQAQPASGLTLEIKDAETDRSLSTKTVTGCLNDSQEGEVCGDFILGRSSSSDESFYLKIWNTNDPAYPVVKVPAETILSTAVPESNTESQLDNSIVTITLPPIPSPVRFGAKVERPQLLSSGHTVHVGIENCLVIFESETEDIYIDGSYKEKVFFNAVTNSTGKIVGLNENYNIYLTPREYRITVLPPILDPQSMEAFSVLTETRNIDSLAGPQDNQLFVLNYKQPFVLRVTAKGFDIPNSIVEAKPIQDDSPYIKTVSSVLTENGEHQLFLEEGKYRLTAKIPTESGYAFAFKEITVKKPKVASLPPEEIVLKNIKAQIPIAAKVIVDSESIDLSGAEIEWYEEIEDNEFILTAKSTVKTRGDTLVLLPPVL